VSACGEWEGWGGSRSDRNHPVRGVDLFHSVAGACRNAGCSPSMIDLVLLTGVGIPDSDAAELSMLEDLWKGEPNKPAVTTVGGHCGHVFGATGPIQVITGLACLSESRVPPVRNRRGRIGLWDEETKRSASQVDVTRALTVTTGLGSRHVSTVVTRWHRRRKVNDVVY
jgi:3-oxoacyl-(acyl-carrier-protein) synthase